VLYCKGMKALVLFTGASGKRDFSKKIPEVKRTLASSFEALDFLKCEKPGDLRSNCINYASKYDVFIIAGGDGTFNAVINAIAPLDKRPTLGFINFGTLGDVGKNFGVTRSLTKALQIIKNGKTKSFDIGKIGNSYFAYVAAFGCYSDIAYKAKRKSKQRWGKASYYTLAAKATMKSAKFAVSYVSDNKRVTKIVPFLMVMNGSDIGGFKVNKKGLIDDGKMELFMPKPSPSNGLLQTLLNPDSEMITISEVDIQPIDSLPWCLDGELGPTGRVSISVLPSWLKVFAQK
jgi:diacylglycerol kinase (ATP)